MDTKDIKKALDLVAMGWNSLEVIEQLVGPQIHTLGGTALAVIQGVLASLMDAKSGKITAEDAHEQIKKLLASLSTHDAAADQKLRDRFR